MGSQTQKTRPKIMVTTDNITTLNDDFPALLYNILQTFTIGTLTYGSQDGTFENFIFKYLDQKQNY